MLSTHQEIIHAKTAVDNTWEAFRGARLIAAHPSVQT